MPKDFFRWEEGGALGWSKLLSKSLRKMLTLVSTSLLAMPHTFDQQENPASLPWRPHRVVQEIPLSAVQDWYIYSPDIRLLLLTATGGSSACMGCKGSDEQRHNRYKEIAELVKELRTIENEQSLSTPITPTSSRFDHAVLDGSTSKKDRKEAKRQAKAADRDFAIRKRDIERIGEILHPEESGDDEFERALLMDKSIETNVPYHPGTSSREERHLFISEERRGKAELKITDAEIDRIMTELKVHNVSHLKDKKERALIGQLREKIVKDLKHDHGEARETMMRKAGFWRWANRKAYNRLAANGRIWDHNNGEALAAVIEHEVEIPDPEAPAAAESVAVVVVTEAADNDKVRMNKEDGVKDDDLLSVASLASEASRPRLTHSASTSRDTSISSVSRTTFSSSDESTDEGWTTVGRLRAPRVSNAFNLKLSAHGGLKHLESKTKPSTPKGSTRFELLSIVDGENEDASNEKPHIPCQEGR